MQSTLRRNATLFTIGLSLFISANTTLSFAQMVGPAAPPVKPQQESKLINSLGKFFNKEKAEEGQSENTPSTEAKAVVTPPPNTPVEEEEDIPPAPRQVYKRPPMLTQPALTNAKIEEAEVDAENPPDMSTPKLDDPTNPLGLHHAETKLKNAINLINNNQPQAARAILIPLRQSLIDTTEAHINLYKILNTVSSARAQAQLEKHLALEFAKLRDRAMMELGRAYMVEKDYSRAIKELVEVVKSQPRSQMGLQSYEMLQEIGFTEKLHLTQ